MPQSVSDFIFSKHYGCTPRGVRGVKRSEILWEIQKYSLPGRPSSQNWIKSKTIYHFLMNFGAFLTVFLILLNFGWMVDLAMSIFEILTKFLIIWHPCHYGTLYHADQQCCPGRNHPETTIYTLNLWAISLNFLYNVCFKKMATHLLYCIQ